MTKQTEHISLPVVDGCLVFNDQGLKINLHTKELTVRLIRGDYVITAAELVKYIGERELIESNELVQAMYGRYQMAAKLVRSDHDGYTRV
jgi:hypothetical protein